MVYDRYKEINLKRDLTVIAIAFILISILFFVNYSYQKNLYNYEAVYKTIATQLQMLGEKISVNAHRAISGNADSFEELKKTKVEYNNGLQILKNGHFSYKNIGYLPPAIDNYGKIEFSNLETEWENVKKSINIILENKSDVLNYYQTVIQLNQELPYIEEQIIKVDKRIKELNLSNNEHLAASELLLILEKINRNILGIILDKANFNFEITKAKDDVVAFENSVNKTLSFISKNNGDNDLNLLAKNLEYRFKQFKSPIERVIDKFPTILNVLNHESGMYAKVDKLSLKSKNLFQSYSETSKKMYSAIIYQYILEGIGLFLVCMTIYIVYTNSRQEHEKSEQEHEKNELMTKKLLDELADLASGNLAVHATVSDGVTGAIAESINYSLDALRGLISVINGTTERVSKAVCETESITYELAHASANQAKEIVAATASVNAIAASIEHVSSNAAESSMVAEKAVNIANNGVHVVQKTIHGMDIIRQQIQDTSKRIKSLGESSQEIGDTVSLINDIADQTNILSLNASIQAAMAGEAGRGFAVVADEIQRLAESASHATKEIATLVRTIQNDTNLAVKSMEQTTIEVVEGTELANDAGVTLEKIEDVIKQLSGLIVNISNESKQQADTSQSISRTMEIIQEIATKSATGTATTAKSVGALADMVVELRRSVDDFTLPKQDINLKDNHG